MFENSFGGYRARLDAMRERMGIYDREPIDLGQSFEFGAANAPAMIAADARGAVLAACRADPLYASSFLAELGWEAIEALKPRPPIEPMPFTDVVAVEVSIGDAYKGKEPPKPAKTESERLRQRLRYTATIQVWIKGAKKFKDVAWKGYADLRDAERAAHDVERLSNPRKCKTPFSSEYADWLTETIIPLARNTDSMIGFLVNWDNGTTYHDQQVILVPSSILNGGQDQNAMLVNPFGPIVLPAFQTPPPSKKANTYVLQSRGAASYPFSPFPEYPGWANGVL